MQPSSYPELTRADVLADPLIRQVMRADQVDDRDLEALLATAAQGLASRTARGTAAPRHGLPTGLRSFWQANARSFARAACGQGTW